MKKALLLSLLITLNACQPNGTKSNTSAAITFPGTDKIVVTYAPKADFTAKDVKKTEITKADVIKAWLAELGKIPRKGPGIKAKIAADAPEHKIEFFQASKSLGTLRMKAGSLDAPADENFDFYEDQDKAFTALVKALK